MPRPEQVIRRQACFASWSKATAAPTMASPVPATRHEHRHGHLANRLHHNSVSRQHSPPPAIGMGAYQGMFKRRGLLDLPPQLGKQLAGKGKHEQVRKRGIFTKGLILWAESRVQLLFSGGAWGGSRTLTPFRITDFKSVQNVNCMPLHQNCCPYVVDIVPPSD